MINIVKRKNGKLQFGLTIPQGWRGGDLELEEEYNSIKQFEFSESVAITADNFGFELVLQAHNHNYQRTYPLDI